jgi:hypothetical protein
MANSRRVVPSADLPHSWSPASSCVLCLHHHCVQSPGAGCRLVEGLNQSKKEPEVTRPVVCINAAMVQVSGMAQTTRWNSSGIQEGTRISKCLFCQQHMVLVCPLQCWPPSSAIPRYAGSGWSVALPAHDCMTSCGDVHTLRRFSFAAAFTSRALCCMQATQADASALLEEAAAGQPGVTTATPKVRRLPR